jgi:hypothetical protein
MSNGLMVATSEAMAEALETIPAGMPWAWAALRVMPAVRGERIAVVDDIEMERLGFRDVGDFPSLELPPGVSVTFAVEAEVVHLTASQAMYDAWEMTPAQVLPAAMANLRRAAGSWRGKVYEDAYQGIPVRLIKGWPHWASSLVLDTDLLVRCFGAHDQVFVAPYQCNLISLPIDVDRDIAADIVDLFGTLNHRALLIGMPAFVLRDGVLTVEDLPGFPDPPDDEDEVAFLRLD